MKKIILILLCFSICLLYGCGRIEKLEWSDLTKSFADISAVKTDTQLNDITIRVSDVEEVTVDYHTSEKFNVDVTQDGGVLSISGRSDEVLNLSLLSTEQKYFDITVSVPKDYAGSFDIKTVTGDITIFGAATGNAFSASVTTGDITVSGCNFSDFTVKATTGEIVAESVDASGFISLSTVTGDIRPLSLSSGKGIDIHTTTGDINGTLKDTGIYIKDVDAGVGQNTVFGVGEGGTIPLSATTSVGDINLIVTK